MITQSIKRWLGKLFAWWPWKHTPAGDYLPPISNLNAGSTSEGVWRTTTSGPLPQPGTTSVAVEHGQNELPPETSRPANEERSDHPEQPHPAVSGEGAATSRRAADAIKRAAASRREMPAPTPEQQLKFLQYLVKRGLINEGFAEGQIPYQYKKLRTPERYQKK